MHTCHLPPNFLHGLILRQPAMKKPSRGSKWTKDAMQTTLWQKIQHSKSNCGSSCFFLRKSSCLGGHCRWVAFVVLHSCITKWKMSSALLSWKRSKTIAYVRNFSTIYVCTVHTKEVHTDVSVLHVTPRQLQLSLVVRWERGNRRSLSSLTDRARERVKRKTPLQLPTSTYVYHTQSLANF